MTQLLTLRNGSGMVQWEPTTDLLCSKCREPFEVQRQTLGLVNFTFDFAKPHALEVGEYWYLHKECSWIEDVLQVHWGWHPMKWVLGCDCALQTYWGSLQKHLRNTMPAGTYDRLYAAWLPAIRPQKQRLAKPHIVTPGYVYLIQAEGASRVKIGRSISAQVRFDSLRTASPFPLRLLRSIKAADCVALERLLHQRYARYRQHGEWFDLPADVLMQLLQEDFSR